MKVFAAILGVFAFLAAAVAPSAADPSGADANAACHAAKSLRLDANAACIAANAKVPGVVVRPSGLQYRILHYGSGNRPGPRDTVTFYYTESLINGTAVSGTEPDFPAQEKLTDMVVPGLTEAFSLMREGDHWQVVIPANIGYGARGGEGGAVPPNQTLILDLTLVTVTPYKEPPHKDDDSSGGGGD